MTLLDEPGFFAIGQPIPLEKSRPIHFIGVGGIGMSGLAKVLAQAGYSITGSDPVLSSYARVLTGYGATLYEGQLADQVPNNAVVIASTAVGPDNPEVAVALGRNQPIYHRSDLLKAVLHHPNFGHQTVVGISGAHGKTSTTGMVGVGLSASGLHPTVVAGGVVPEFGTNAMYEGGSVAVAELDESDGTLVQYQPTHSVLLNIELDHAEHFHGGLPGFLECFKQFLRQLPNGGKVWINLDCRHSVAVFEAAGGHLSPLFFTQQNAKPSSGYETAPLYQLVNVLEASPGCFQGEIMLNHQPLTQLGMSTPGRHQLTNGMVAVSVCHQLAAPLDLAVTAIGDFRGMKRRFERLGTWQGVTLVDDYAHHPTELMAMLSTLRQVAGSKARVTAIIQPHRFTRLQTFWEGFVKAMAFAHIDRLIVTDVFEASEPPIPGVDSTHLLAALNQANPAGSAHRQHYPGKDFSSLIQELQSSHHPGDWIMTCGAGTVTQILRGWSDSPVAQGSRP